MLSLETDVFAVFAVFAVFGVSVAALFETVRGHVQLARAVKAAREPSSDGGASTSVPSTPLPSVTVVRPIKGKDVGLEENLQAALSYDYAGPVQTIFVLDDDRDPAYPSVVRAIRDGKRRGLDVALILAGEPPAGMTGKLHAMKRGVDRAKGDVIAFADSDTRPRARLLRDLVAPLLADEKVGATFAPVVVSAPATPGDVGYALMLNGLYGPFARLAAEPEGELPFIMGQFMAFRRDTLQAIGGVEGTAGELVDDMSIGLRMTAAGYKNVMIKTPMTIVQDGLTLPQFASVYRRWITFSRTGLPVSFKIPQHLRAALIFVQLAVFLVGAALGVGALMGLGAAGMLAAGLSVNLLYNLYANEPLRPWQHLVIFPLFLYSPVIYGQVLMGRQVSWRGRTYQLNNSGALARKWTASDASLASAEFVPSAEFRTEARS